MQAKCAGIHGNPESTLINQWKYLPTHKQERVGEVEAKRHSTMASKAGKQ